MGLSLAIDDANNQSAVPRSASQTQQLGQYRIRAARPPRKLLRLTIEVLRLTIEIPIPAARSIAFVLPVISLHGLLVWAALHISHDTFARVIAPIMVKFLPPQENKLPPEPPMLPAAALEPEIDPLLNMLPPSLTLDAFEPESRAITTGFVAPKKPTPKPVIAQTVEEEGQGVFVRPRPIRGRTGKQTYPVGAAAAGESGRATVKICITARGTVESVEITESTGFARLDNDALDVARQYQFRPATRDGKPIPVCMPYSINYRIR